MTSGTHPRHWPFKLGGNVKVVQRMLGHASAAMTLDVYSDLFDDDLDSVSTALDAAYRAASPLLRSDGLADTGEWIPKGVGLGMN
jgi:hypothetical protein